MPCLVHVFTPRRIYSCMGGAMASWLARLTPDRPGRGHCVVFLASLHPGVEMVTGKLNRSLRSYDGDREDKVG